MLTTCINWPNGTETFLFSCFRWLRVIGHHRPHSPLWLYLCLFHLLTKDFPSLTSWKMIFSVDFCSDLAFLGGILLSFDSFRYNRDLSMKNRESIGWLYDWFNFSPDYVRGMKQKLRTSRNKTSMQILVTMMYGAYMTVLRPTGAHINF